MKKLFVGLTFLATILWITGAHGAPVSYSITGNLSNLHPAGDGGPDTGIYGLEGQPFSAKFTIKPDLDHIYPEYASSEGTAWAYYKNPNVWLGDFNFNVPFKYVDMPGIILKPGQAGEKDQFIVTFISLFDGSEDPGPFNQHIGFSASFSLPNGTIGDPQYFQYGSQDPPQILTAYSPPIFDSNDVSDLTAEFNINPHFGDGGFYYYGEDMTVTSNAVPLPSTILLLGSGLVGLGIYRRNRKQKI